MLRRLLHALFIVAVSLTGSAAVEISESSAETEELDEATRSIRRAHPTRMSRVAVEPSVGRRPAGLPHRPSPVRDRQGRTTERPLLKIPPPAGDPSSPADGD
jgi:hypothetical protein